MKTPSRPFFPLGLIVISLSCLLLVRSANWQPVLAVSSTVGADVLTTITAAGSARVLVLLTVSGEPASAGAGQATAIAQAQTDVLTALPPDQFQVKHRYQTVPGLAGTVTATGLETLRTHPAVAAVYLDQPGGGHLDKSVPALGANFVQTTYGLTGQGVTVAVLDTGIDTDHPDLADSVVGQHCFTDNDCRVDNTFESDNAEDENGHGTHVAGIITSNGVVAGRGFAPDAAIVAVRVLDESNTGFVSDWVAGLDWVRAHLDSRPVHIINMSLGTFALYTGVCDVEEPLLASVIRQLTAAGVVIFASSGNQGSAIALAAPACNSDVIAVGATYDSDVGRQPIAGTYQSGFGNGWPNCFDLPTTAQTITCFSNSNEWLDVVAPGAPIEAPGLGGGKETYWGTSQASPTAAGVAALLLDADARLTPAELERRLKASGPLVTDRKNGLRFPLLNARNAIVDLLPKPPTALQLTGPITGSVGFTHTFTAVVTPLTTTQPITYVWQLQGRPTITHAAGLSDSLPVVWPTPGAQKVSVTALNGGGRVSATHVITLAVAPVTGLVITGPVVGSVGVSQTFTAESSPLQASPPFTYTWQAGGQPPLAHTGGITDQRTLLWDEPGVQSITVTVRNATSTVTATHRISIEIVAPLAVSISGASVEVVNFPVTFLAAAQPISASLPITYVWQASGQVTGQSTVTHTQRLTDVIQFVWNTSGPVTLTVTATNRGGVVVDSHSLAVVEEKKAYLPFVQR